MRWNPGRYLAGPGYSQTRLLVFSSIGTLLRTPDFLIIGAPKSGTTTLYRDLLTNPSVFFPVDKEPGDLSDGHVLTAAGAEQYAALYRAARPDQVCGDATTDYSKMPDIQGVPARAEQVCGANLRIIYIVRNPLQRIISQHYHDVVMDLSDPDINDAVREDPRLLNYSRYAMQLRPWVNVFGRDQIRVTVFEDFVADRVGGAISVAKFLGIPPRPDLIRTDHVYNRTGEEKLKAGRWGTLHRSSTYRRMRRVLPVEIRRRLRQTLLPKPPPPPDPPRADTISFILSELADDLRAQEAMLFRDSPMPWRLS